MLNFFQPLQTLFSFEKVAIDNDVFRLHYKVSARSCRTISNQIQFMIHHNFPGYSYHVHSVLSNIDCKAILWRSYWMHDRWWGGWWAILTFVKLNFLILINSKYCGHLLLDPWNIHFEELQDWPDQGSHYSGEGIFW